MSERPEVEALAEAWASIDGKLASFQRERSQPDMAWDHPEFKGHYVGYISEAEEMIRRLEARGFTVTALPKQEQG